MERREFFFKDGSINMRAAERAARQARGSAVRNGLRIFRRTPTESTNLPL